MGNTGNINLESEDMWIWWLLGAVGFVLVGLAAWRLTLPRWRRFADQVRCEHARELFRLQEKLLHDAFFQAASSRGVPRGLQWARCEWDGDVAFGRERATGRIVALAGVILHFRKEPGGSMDDVDDATVEAPRQACAVFYYDRGHWITEGVTVMNHSPTEALAKLAHTYEPLPELAEAAAGK